MSHKLGICIPYRDREEHLKKLVPHLRKHLNRQGIDHKFYVAHQVDDKLFNRGAMKNIAAKRAFEDGCDYIAWHDVDMLPYDETCDYSYPEETPIHIATQLSKYGYDMSYDQYFGGVILFNKEQVERTNGYSNDYWDWGMEDDDLFWRAYYEGYTTGKVISNKTNRPSLYFNGDTSHVEIPSNRRVVEYLNRNHTITLLVKTQQQEDKVPIWLVGDEDRQFIEYPIFRKSGGFNYGISFNNSRAMTFQLFDMTRAPIYNWIKRFENMWTRLTISIDAENKKMYCYVNDELATNVRNKKEERPLDFDNRLLRYDLRNPFYLGFDPQANTRLKGEIAECKVYNRFFTPEEISHVFEGGSDGAVMDLDFENISDGKITDKVNGIVGTLNDIEIKNTDIEIVENILPYRRDGKFYCLPHLDLGFVNGKWHQGETTAKNEKRFVREMQQKKIDYKNDGMSNLKYELVETIMFDDDCEMLNVKL
jgi:hypothetical protein